MTSLSECPKVDSILDDATIAKILAVTHELFPGDVGIELMFDPAEPSIDFVVFNVIGKGELDELLENEIEWGMRVAPFETRNSSQVRLNVVPEK